MKLFGTEIPHWVIPVALIAAATVMVFMTGVAIGLQLQLVIK